MSKYKRTPYDKLKTLLFGKDVRVTSGEPFPEIYDGDFSSYFPKDKYICPQSPDSNNVFNASDFGAVSGENATKSINNAIEKCFETGGGTVVVKDGDYIVNTVYLKDNVTLFIDSSAKLIASHDTQSYEKEAMIFAHRCKNIEITGGGKICGEGNFFGLKPIKEPCFEPSEIIDIIDERQQYRSRIRFAHMSKYGSICHLSECENVKVHNIIFENSASWTLHLHMCQSVFVYDFMINNNRHTANADGIDINCSSDIKINHCFISTADDGICIKNAVYTGCIGEMKNVSVSDCEVISCTNAFKIGTETTNDIHGISVKNCKFFMNDIYPGSVSGISLEACDGSSVYDVNISDIEMERVACPLFIRLGNRNRAAKVDENTARATEMAVDDKKPSAVSDKKRFNFKSELYDINISDIKACDIEQPLIISGFRDSNGTKRIKNVVLKNFDMNYRNATEIIDKRIFIPEYAKQYPEASRFRNLPSYRMFVRHCGNLKYENINCIPAPKTVKQKDYFKDIK